MSTENAQSATPVQSVVIPPMSPYFERDGITIYNADCRQVLPFLGTFDLLLTDPPYGIGESVKANKRAADGSERGKRGTSTMGVPNTKPKFYESSEWDRKAPPRWFFDSVNEVAGTSIIWGVNYYGLAASSCWLVWDKKNEGTDFADCELAWTNMPKAVRKFSWRWNGMLQEKSGRDKETRVHPTQKPLPLMRWCLGLVRDAETILDPFMGSGTTLVAAKLEGRQAVGIEINEKYCEAAAKRLEQGTLF